MQVLLTIGLNDQHTREQIMTVDSAKLFIMKTLIAHGCQGGSVWAVEGFYTHNDGTLVVENSICVNTSVELGIDRAIEIIRAELNQESIYVSMIESVVDFVEQH